MIRMMLEVGLSIALAAIYVSVVTPLAWLARLLGRRAIAMRPSPSAQSYWVRADIDSCVKSLYLHGAVDPGTTSRAGQWPGLIRAYRQIAASSSIPWKWLVLPALVPLAWLARPPEEAAISSELYVLF